MTIPYELIFLIPFLVGVVYVIREFFLYNKEMKQWINHPNHKFDLMYKDDLPYVVPKVKGEIK